jgi:hypothetical protein
MVGHNPDNFIVAQVSSSHKVSVGLLVRSQRVLWSQPGAAKQLFKCVDGERLRKIVDGLVIHALGSQDPLDLAALASSRLLVDRDFGGRHCFPSLCCFNRAASADVTSYLEEQASDVHPVRVSSCCGWRRQLLPVREGMSRACPDLRESSQRECGHGDEEIANCNVEKCAH